jgi:hypothetical protein
MSRRVRWSAKQLDQVSVWIANENLGRAVRSFDGTADNHSQSLKVLMPCFQIFDSEREMVTSLSGSRRRLNSPADDVQFLRCTQPEPRARKVECGSLNLLEPQNAPIELAAPFDIAHVNGHMIQFQDFHCCSNLSSSFLTGC